MSRNIERHGTGKDDDRTATGEYFNSEIKKSLYESNGAALIEGVRQAPDDEVLQTIGLRVLLRDFWIKRKADLARIAEADANDLEATVKAMFQAMDNDIMLLVQGSPDDDTDKTEQLVARQRHNALVAELERLDVAARIDFMNRFSQLDEAVLDTPENLLSWVEEWRDDIVERLWRVVGANREEGDVGEEMNAAVHEVHGHLGKLVRGTLHPMEVS